MKINLFNNIQKYQQIEQRRRKISFCSSLSPAHADCFVRSAARQTSYLDTQLYNKNFADIKMTQDMEAFCRAQTAGIAYFESAIRYLDILKTGPQDTSKFNELCLGTISPEGRECFEPILKKANIDSKEELIKLIETSRTLAKRRIGIITNPSIFIEAYASLENPSEDCIDFADIIEELSIRNNLYGGNFNLKEHINFAKQLGAKTEHKFCKLFTHQKDSFNGFKDGEDKASLLLYEMKRFPTIYDFLKSLQARYPKYIKKDPLQLYLDNIALIDFVTESNEKYKAALLTRVLICKEMNEEKFHPSALEEASRHLGTTGTETEVQLYDFAYSEGIYVGEINSLTKKAWLSDVDLFETVINYNEIVACIQAELNFNKFVARAIYLNFPQILNVAFKAQEEKDISISPILCVISVISKLELKSDKDFIEFYKQVKHSETKAQKGKKKQKGIEISKKDIEEFINLLNFIDDEMIEKYKKDKNYPLKEALINKRKKFEALKPSIEKELNEDANRFFYPSAFDIFMLNYEDFKRGFNTQSILNKIRTEYINNLQQQEERDQHNLFAECREFFGNKTYFWDFVDRNNINFTQQNQKINQLYLQLLKILFANKSQEDIDLYCEKLAQSDFIRNSRNELPKLIKSGEEEHIRTILEIALEEDISSLSELNKLIKPFSGGNKTAPAILTFCAEQEIPFKKCLNRLTQIQEELNTYGINVQINNDNISSINADDLTQKKLGLKRCLELAKQILNPESEGNFIAGLKDGLSDSSLNYNSKRIAKEIVRSQTGKYEEGYNRIINYYRISAQDLGFPSPADPKYQNALEEIFKYKLQKFVQFVNNQNLFGTIDGRTPNMSLHAKMRLIDRFIFDQNSQTPTLSTEEIQNIIKTIYTQAPYKIIKSKGKEGFSAYYTFNDYEIKAVFSETGEMITIAKNEL